MATTDQAIEKLIEVFSILSDCVPMSSGTKKIINDKLDSLKRDNDAGTAEIDLCGKCKQRPCGCKKAMCKCPKPYSIGGVLCSYCGNHLREEEPADKPCEHESKYVVSGYVSQNGVTCVICSQCSTVGKRFDDGKIEWWPASGNEMAISILNELKTYLKSYVGEYTNASTMWIDAKLAQLGGTA